MTVTSTLIPNAGASSGVVYAVGVVRVSKVGKREGDAFKSPREQRDRIDAALRAQNIELAEVFEELDVSGKRPLHKRHGLLRAVQAVESGHAQVIVVAYFDRLVRNLRVQAEVLERVEAAGGRVLAVDVGQVQTATAAQWLSSTLLGAVAEYYSRSVGERLAGTQAMSIAAGVPIGTLPPGYRKEAETRRISLHEAEAQVMREAFELRAEGASWLAVRRHMTEGGIVRTVGSVRKLLHSRTYLGELFFGKLSNSGSHPAIIDRATFDRVQRNVGESFKTVPGRKSLLLLSGLRLLKCGTCGKSLAAATQVQAGKSYPTYRCNPMGVCARRVSIDATIADAAVADYVRTLVADESATEGPGMQMIEARTAADGAQAALERGIRNLALVADEPSAQQTLAELRQARDAAADRAAELERAARAVGTGVTLNAGMDWPALTLDEQRDIITAVLDRVEVAPGNRHFRGVERLRFVTVRDASESLS